MRPSPLRHTLAVLRNVIGLTQKEMAALLECSVPTVQAIELGKLKLSQKLGARVAFQTAVSLRWLLEDDPSRPPEDDHDRPYNKRVFDQRQSVLHSPPKDDEDQCFMLWLLWARFRAHVLLLSEIFVQAQKANNVDLVSFKLLRATREAIQDDLSIDYEELDRLHESLRKDGGLATFQNTIELVHRFAHRTFHELERVLGEKKVPLSDMAQNFLRLHHASDPFRVKPTTQRSPKNPSPRRPIPASTSKSAVTASTPSPSPKATRARKR